MSTRSILALVSGTEEDHLVLGKAAELAALFAGRLSVLASFPSPTMQLSYVSPPSGYVDPSVVDQLRRDYEDRKAEVRTRLSNAAQLAGLGGERVNFTAPEVNIWDAVRARLSLTDMVVAGPSAACGDLVARLLMDAGAPVLIARPELKLERFTVAIAWDNGLAAGAALRVAMPLIQRAHRVVALQHVPEMGDAEPGSQGLSALADYLKLHGLTTDLEELTSRIDTGEAIVEAARGNQADILVAGAYGHWRLAELILGGVTRTLLKAAWPSVLLAH